MREEKESEAVSERPRARRPGTSEVPLGAIVREIRLVAGTARVLLLTREVTAVLALALAGAGAMAMLDYLLRLPQGVRLIAWIAGLGALGWVVVRRVVPAWRFRLTPTNLALRVERSEGAEAAGLAGELASAIELGRTRGEGVEAALARASVAEAVNRWRPGLAWAVLRPREAALALLGLVVVVGSLGGVWGLAPGLARTGFLRVATPWMGAEWPRRYLVADATEGGVQPLGVTLPLRAALLTTDRAEGRTRVMAHYRVVGGGAEGEVRRVQLTGQGSRMATAHGEGELYERLIETRSLAAPGEDATVEIEYWFRSPDDRTEPARLRLRAPPRVARASAHVTPPDYARSASHARLGFVEGAIEAGRGTDQRALVGPVLIGSRIRLEAEFTRPVPVPEAEGSGALLSALLPEARFEGDPEVSIEATPGRWVVTWRALGTSRVPIVPVDADGIASTDAGDDPSVFIFETVTDGAPTVRVAEPAEDESVLPGAVVAVLGEARDDVALAWVSLERQIARSPAGSRGAPAEGEGGREEIARTTTDAEASRHERASVSVELDLSTLEVSPGDEVRLWAVAADTLASAGLGRGAERSRVRRLRIIGEEDLISQVQGALGAVREAAKRLDERQAEVAERLEREGASREAARAQAEIPGRLARQRETVEGLQRRIERNRLEDRALADTLERARALLRSAEGASGRAAGAIEEAGALPEDDPDRERLGEAAREEQDRTRDELASLVDLLDRGQDSWLAKRSIERLAREQRELARRTGELGRETIGREPEELSPEERAEIERLAERQEELRERAERAVDELSRRAEELSERDPLQSSAMRDAAERGRRERAAQQMSRAAEQVSENRTAEAQESQQRAAETLERMLEDLEGAERNRDETLRRILASLIESIEALIGRQEREIAALEDGLASGDLAGLDAGMIRLHRNTLGVLDQPDLEIGEFRRIGELIEDAALAQQEAVVALRADPADGAGAKGHEEESLRRLIEARDEARRVQEAAAERDAERRREELRRAYLGALETQVELHEETGPLVGAVETRRDRLIVRRLGARQSELADTLAELRAANEEIDTSTMFSFAHDRLDGLMRAAAERLGEGEATPRVALDQQGAIRVLQQLVEVLRRNPGGGRGDQFAGGQGGGGQQGGQQGESPILPPAAELLLLKAMQEEIAERTRTIDESGEVAPEEVSGVADLQQELASRAEVMLEEARRRMTPREAPGREPLPQPDPDPVPDGGE